MNFFFFLKKRPDTKKTKKKEPPKIPLKERLRTTCSIERVPGVVLCGTLNIEKSMMDTPHITLNL